VALTTDLCGYTQPIAYCLPTNLLSGCLAPYWLTWPWIASWLPRASWVRVPPVLCVSVASVLRASCVRLACIVCPSCVHRASVLRASCVRLACIVRPSCLRLASVRPSCLRLRPSCLHRASSVLLHDPSPQTISPVVIPMRPCRSRPNPTTGTLTSISWRVGKHKPLSPGLWRPSRVTTSPLLWPSLRHHCRCVSPQPPPFPSFSQSTAVNYEMLSQLQRLVFNMLLPACE